MKNDPSKKTYSQLEKENRELRASQHAIANEFRSQIDDVVRAQFAIECITSLLCQIDHKLFSDHVGARERLQSIKSDVLRIKHEIRMEWAHLIPGVRKRKGDLEVLADKYEALTLAIKSRVARANGD